MNEYRNYFVVRYERRLPPLTQKNRRRMNHLEILAYERKRTQQLKGAKK